MSGDEARRAGGHVRLCAQCGHRDTAREIAPVRRGLRFHCKTGERCGVWWLLCVPVGRHGLRLLRNGRISERRLARSTDVGSVKAECDRTGWTAPARGRPFYPAHSVGGARTHSGPTSGFAELCRQPLVACWCPCPTPTPTADFTFVHLLGPAWGQPRMERGASDLVLAVTSHAPHLTAYTSGPGGPMICAR